MYVANAPEQGESASEWLARQTGMLETMGIREDMSNPTVAQAYIDGMRHAVSIVEYFEEFALRQTEELLTAA